MLQAPAAVLKAISPTSFRAQGSNTRRTACDRFTLDLCAEQFGACTCGAPKAAHTDRPIPTKATPAGRSPVAKAEIDEERALLELAKTGADIGDLCRLAHLARGKHADSAARAALREALERAGVRATGTRAQLEHCLLREAEAAAEKEADALVRQWTDARAAREAELDADASDDASHWAAERARTKMDSVRRVIDSVVAASPVNWAATKRALAETAPADADAPSGHPAQINECEVCSADGAATVFTPPAMSGPIEPATVRLGMPVDDKAPPDMQQAKIAPEAAPEIAPAEPRRDGVLGALATWVVPVLSVGVAITAMCVARAVF